MQNKQVSFLYYPFSEMSSTLRMFKDPLVGEYPGFLMPFGCFGHIIKSNTWQMPCDIKTVAWILCGSFSDITLGATAKCAGDV